MRRMSTSTSVTTARIIYVLICELAGAAIANQTAGEEAIWKGMMFGLLVAGFFIVVESLMKKFTLRGFSHATVGLLIGVACAWLLSKGVVNLLEVTLQDKVEFLDAILLSVHVTLYATLGFLGAVIAIRSSKDDFALLIPYVHFRSESNSGPPVVMDDSIINDNRLWNVLNTGFIDSRLIVPRFILEKVHIMANSSDVKEHTLGECGLDNLERIQASPDFQISVHDLEGEDMSDNHETRLMNTCRILSAKLFTTDVGFTKTARFQDINVLNINDLHKALKENIVTGDRLRIKLVRLGKDKTQAIGYLPDGSMIVVNAAADKVNSMQEVIIISTLDTDSGKLTFAELYKE